jgi:hypothetical protein
MKFEEVFPAFRQGKRIRRTCFATNDPKSWVDKTDQTPMSIDLENLLAEDWEIEQKKIEVSLKDLQTAWNEEIVPRSGGKVHSWEISNTFEIFIKKLGF